MKVPKYIQDVKVSEYGPDGQSAFFAWITPAKAQAILDATNTGNIRSIRSHRVKTYRDAMSAGEWAVGSDALCFDAHGRLTQGQHRLSALAGAEVDGAWFLVLVGATDKDERAMDQGLLRSISITHGTSQKHAATIRLIAFLAYGQRTGVSRHIIAGIAKKYEKDIELCHVWAGGVAGGGSVVAAAALVALIARPAQRAAIADTMQKIGSLDLRTPELRIVKRWIDQHSPLSHWQAQERCRNTATLVKGIETCVKREGPSHLRACDSHPWIAAAAEEMWPIVSSVPDGDAEAAE